MENFHLLIGGQLVPGAAKLAVVNPATEEVLAEAPRADRAQLDAAVAAAKAAFPACRSWRSRTAQPSCCVLPRHWNAT